jgi:hypothetical protein
MTSSISAFFAEDHFQFGVLPIWAQNPGRNHRHYRIIQVNSWLGSFLDTIVHETIVILIWNLSLSATQVILTYFAYTP